jgi:hypothetical protein
MQHGVERNLLSNARWYWRYDMTPALLFSLITTVLGALAALNYFYFYNMPLTRLFTILAVISLSITAFVFFFDDD